MAPHPLINESVPEFSLPDANGHMFKFPPEEQGVRVKKPIALFFYPEAGKHSCIDMLRPEVLCSSIRCTGTFGCTREACQFRDALVGMTLPLLHRYVYALSMNFQRKRSSSGLMSRSSG